MTIQRIRPITLAAGALLLVAAAGCSGSSDDTGSTDATADSAASEVESADTEVESPDTEPADAESGAEPSEICAALESIGDQFAEIDESGAAVDADTIIDAFERLDEAAPDELSSDTSDALAFIRRGAEISELPADEQGAAAEEMTSLETSYDEATSAIDDYARANCDNLDEEFFGGS